MMITKVLILEDSAQTADVIRRIILEKNDRVQVEIAATAAQAYAISMEKSIDVFMVDIVLDTEHPGDTGGMKFAQNIREIPKYYFTPIIFITALADPELYAYKDIHCFGYIEKPFDKKQVEKLLETALLYSTEVRENKKVFLRKDGILYALNLLEIVYIQVCHHKMFLYTRDGSIEIPYKTIKTFQQENESMHLLQCNRSTLINGRYIEYIDTTNFLVKLRGVNEAFEIGMAYRNKLLEWADVY